MHPEAHAWVVSCVETFNLSGEVLELGGRDVNGGVRGAIPHDSWISVDIIEGPGVDIVGDAADLRLEERFDVVVSTEVFEHAPRSSEIVKTAFRHLRVGGVFVATMAGPQRQPHGADGSHRPKPGEWYMNVFPDELKSWLQEAGFNQIEVDERAGDVRCWARRGH